jgi:hypothetical protein
MGSIVTRPMYAALVLGFAAIFSTSSALASAVVQAVKGEARAAVDLSRHGPVVPGQRYEPGATFTTGAGGQIVLRFDDGQRVVINENSQFKIAAFKFDEAKPAEDRSVFDLIKGALRVISGTIGKRSQASFQLRVPQATIGIRGTDFMVVLVNPAYISVLQGAVAATNAAGTVAFGAGAVGTVANFTALAVTIPASALPAAAAGAFGNMSAVTVGAAGAAGSAASGAAGATGAAAGGIGAGTGLAIGAAAAAAAAAAGGGGGSTTTTHH